MPNIGQFHPQIVHFVVVALFLGVAARLVSLTGRLQWTNYAATALILIGTVAAILAVQSGTDAHGPVERIPGARDLVMEHEDLGHDTRNIFEVVAAIELIALGLARRPTTAKYKRYAYVASAILGVVGSAVLYEAAEHGGTLVYSYGGGPGLRTGDPQDVDRVLLAALYNASQRDRRAGRNADAAALVAEMAHRFPNDTAVRLLRAESLLLDLKNYRGALAALDSVKVPASNSRLVTRQATLKADVYLALGRPDSARAVLAPVVAGNPRLKAKLDSIK